MRCNDFQHGRRPPSWIFKFRKIFTFDRYYTRILHKIYYYLPHGMMTLETSPITVERFSFVD